MDLLHDHSLSPVDADETAFYQELTRRILMLTDEDDDDKEVCLNGVTGLERRVVARSGVGSRLVARNYYSWSGIGRSSVPSWMESLWATGGGGTGVFIPSGAATDRHGKKSGRRRRNNNNKATKNNDRGRVYTARK